MSTLKERVDSFQKAVYDATRASGWDRSNSNSLPEELMHIQSELSEAFEEWRLKHDCLIYTKPEDGLKPYGVPIEFADVLIGLFYNAERMGFSLWDALEIKVAYNSTRDYGLEGRQLH